MREVANNKVTSAKSSANWRFLPDMPATGSALIIGAATGIHAVYQPLYCSATCPTSLSAYDKASFDLIAFSTHPPNIEQMPAIQHWLRQDGTLYIGFAGKFSKLLQIRGDSPNQLIRQLNQNGFSQVKLFGAIPNPSRAIFYFPLQGEAMQFAISKYLNGRNLGKWFNRLAHPRWLSRCKWAMPAYSLVAKR